MNRDADTVEVAARGSDEGNGMGTREWTMWDPEASFSAQVHDTQQLQVLRCCTSVESYQSATTSVQLKIVNPQHS